MGVCHSYEIQSRRVIGNYTKTCTPIKKFNSKSLLKIQIQTWKNKNLPNLRSAADTTIKKVTINKPGQIIFSERKDSILFVQSKPEQTQILDTEFDYRYHPCSVLTLNVQKGMNDYKIKYHNDHIYELITSQKQLNEGQKFFFGGNQYEYVKLIHDQKYTQGKLNKVSKLRDQSLVKTTDYMKSFKHLPTGKEQIPTCRICLDQQITTQNPLICPCDCTGSVKYFHLKCWTTWIFSSQLANQGFYIGNVIREQCDLCKKNLLKDKLYRQTVAALLSSAAKIKAPFIVLEGLVPESNSVYLRKNSAKLSYIIVSFADKKHLKLGKGNVDVPVFEQSSKSRNITNLILKGNKVFINDENSKRGTYIRAQDEISISNDIKRYFLYRNHLISVRIE